MTVFDVNALFAPLSFAEFYQRHFLPGEPWIRRGSLEAFREIESMKELSSAAALSNSLKDGAILFGPSGFNARLSSARDAIQFYNNGFTIYASGVEKSIPDLTPFIDEVGYYFGCPSGGVTCEAFASRPGAGASMHYDFDVNFRILLRGKKKWKVAKNSHFQNPLETHFVLDPRSYNGGVDRTLVDKQTFPTTMPADSLEFVAEPGTILFLPRGVWHETLAIEECMGVNFVLKATPWASILTKLLFSKLVEDVAWRGFSFGALGLGATDDLDAPGYDVARTLMPLLKDVVARITPEELLVAASSNTFAWVRGGTPSVVEEGGPPVLSVQFDDDRAPTKMTLSHDAVSFVRGLIERTLPFRTDQVLKSRGDVPVHLVPHLLAQLVENGILVSE